MIAAYAILKRAAAIADTRGPPVRFALTTGDARDNHLVLTLLSALKSGAMLLSDRGFDADWIRTFVSQHGAWANIFAETEPERGDLLQPPSIVLVIWSNDFSTRSSSVGVSLLATTSSQ